MKSACLVLGLAGAIGAQPTSPTMSDATVVARGAFRFRGGVEWIRINGVFGPDGSTVLPVGYPLTNDLNVSTLPLLSNAETLARTLTGDPSITLSAGQLTTSVDSRIASVPISLEYGLTSRITLGAMVPIVQSRSVLTWQLNGPNDNTANVGTNPVRFHGSGTARLANATVAVGLTTARDELQQRVATCATAPLSPGCDDVNARAAEANALIASTTSFAGGVGALYGISEDLPGAVFVPIAGSDLQAAIDARLAAIRAGYSSFGVDAGASSLAPAQAQAANAQLQQIVRSIDHGIGLDSLGTTEQTGIGDIELSASMLLFDTFRGRRGADSLGPRPLMDLRLTVTGVIRLGTGHPARENRPFDVPTGDGQTDYEVRGAADIGLRRLLTTVAGTYTVQTGSIATTRLPAAPGMPFGLDFPVEGSIGYGNMTSVRVNPRFLITPGLMVGVIGIGSFRGADKVIVTGFNPAETSFGNPNSLTTYAGGFTLAYSNVGNPTASGDRNFPAEVVFSHIEMLGSSAAGAENTSRDSIELRIYLRSPR